MVSNLQPGVRLTVSLLVLVALDPLVLIGAVHLAGRVRREYSILLPVVVNIDHDALQSCHSGSVLGTFNMTRVFSVFIPIDRCLVHCRSSFSLSL